MTTVPSHQPRYMAGATALRAAIIRKGWVQPEVAKRLGISNSRVNNWTAARIGIPEPFARRLGRLLGLEDWRVLDTSPRGKGKGKGKGEGEGQPTPQDAPGPARRAVMLLEAQRTGANGHAVQTPSRVPHAPAGVFGMQANTDGTMSVWVRAADLPFDKGATLVRLLLDMELAPRTGVEPHGENSG